MAKFKDEEGNEVEAFTQDEIDQRIEEAKKSVQEEYEVQNQETQQQLEAARSEKEELEQKMKDAEEAGGTQGGDDKQSENFRTLKEALNKKDEEMKSLREQVEQTESQRIEDYKQKMIEQYAGDDEDLKKKIEHNYDKILSGVETKGEKDIAEKVRNSFKLAADENTPDPLNSVLQGGAPGPDASIQNGGSNGVEFNQNEIALGDKMGITQEEREKYGPKLQSNPRN